MSSPPLYHVTPQTSCRGPCSAQGLISTKPSRRALDGSQDSLPAPVPELSPGLIERHSASKPSMSPVGRPTSCCFRRSAPDILRMSALCVFDIGPAALFTLRATERCRSSSRPWEGLPDLRASA